MIKEISVYKLIKELLIVEQKFNEGLIMTHDIHDSKDALEHFFEFNQLIKLDIVRNKIHIIVNDLNIKSLTSFLLLVNNLGYYLSNITLYNQYNNPNKLKYEDFKDKYFDDSILKNITKFDFTLEPKFDIKHELKANTLYHVTETKYVDKILKNGLIAKTKNTLSDYPERIYFTYDLKDSEQYINSKKSYYVRNQYNISISTKSKFPDIEYIVLEITLPNDNDFIFYEDPNFVGKGVYTYDNISSNYIKLIQK